EHRTAGGWVSLPFRSGCAITPRQYARAVFINNATDAAAAGAAEGLAFDEILREQIRAAVHTWGQCPADFNRDGSVNVQCFLAFLQAYATGDRRADYNGDGRITVQDFLAFLQAYAAG